MKSLIAFSIAVLVSVSACAKSVWSRKHLDYYSPDDVDDAFAKASKSLSYAVRRVKEEKGRENNAAKRKVSPRTVDSDGVLVLVHPHDWTSGFFPGELWMMYEFTHDPYWREQTVSYTWPIEESKLHGGTHDLGFMMGNIISVLIARPITVSKRLSRGF